MVSRRLSKNYRKKRKLSRKSRKVSKNIRRKQRNRRKSYKGGSRAIEQLVEYITLGVPENNLPEGYTPNEIEEAKQIIERRNLLVEYIMLDVPESTLKGALPKLTAAELEEAKQIVAKKKAKAKANETL